MEMLGMYPTFYMPQIGSAFFLPKMPCELPAASPATVAGAGPGSPKNHFHL